jgi:molybdopterin synthase sulfur carrier subunit
MRIAVLIPKPLRKYTAKRELVDIDARTVDEALVELVAQYVDLRRHLFTETGALRNFVHICVNNQESTEHTILRDGDQVSILPLFSPCSAADRKP